MTAPLVFFYGHTSLQENPELYKKLLVRNAVRVFRAIFLLEEGGDGVGGGGGYSLYRKNLGDIPLVWCIYVLLVNVWASSSPPYGVGCHVAKEYCAW